MYAGSGVDAGAGAATNGSAIVYATYAGSNDAVAVAGAGAGGAPDAAVYREADPNQMAMYVEANNTLGLRSSVEAGDEPHYDVPQEEYAAREAGKAAYASSA